jgi:putative acetyltransferase
VEEAVKAGGSFVISAADGATDIAAARELFHEYAAGLSINLCFQNFEEELAALPGNYAPPTGCLLLAKVDERNVGCVALRQLEPRIAELKRLFVQPAFRGWRIAKSLIEHALTFARQASYRAVRLDTLREMSEAIALYTGFGFKEIAPYNTGGVEGIQYFELQLFK